MEKLRYEIEEEEEELDIYADEGIPCPAMVACAVILLILVSVALWINYLLTGDWILTTMLLLLEAIIVNERCKLD